MEGLRPKAEEEAGEGEAVAGGQTPGLGVFSACTVSSEQGPQTPLAYRFCLFLYLCSLSPFKWKSSGFHSDKQLVGGYCFPHPTWDPAEDMGISGCFSVVSFCWLTPLRGDAWYNINSSYLSPVILVFFLLANVGKRHTWIHKRKGNP